MRKAGRRTRPDSVCKWRTFPLERPGARATCENRLLEFVSRASVSRCLADILHYFGCAGSQTFSFCIEKVQRYCALQGEVRKVNGCKDDVVQYATTCWCNTTLCNHGPAMPKGLPRIHRTGPPHDENSSSSTALEDEPYEPEPPIEDTFFKCIFRQNTNKLSCIPFFTMLRRKRDVF